MEYTLNGVFMQNGGYDTDYLIAGEMAYSETFWVEYRKEHMEL